MERRRHETRPRLPFFGAWCFGGGLVLLGTAQGVCICALRGGFCGESSELVFGSNQASRTPHDPVLFLFTSNVESTETRSRNVLLSGHDIIPAQLQRQRYRCLAGLQLEGPAAGSGSTTATATATTSVCALPAATVSVFRVRGPSTRHLVSKESLRAFFFTLHFAFFFSLPFHLFLQKMQKQF